MKNLNVLIVEDEPGAAVNLQSMLMEVAPHIKVVGIVSSVEETVEWLTAKSLTPDLGFFDIQLEDGLSFDVFRKAYVNFPVIFTTAFDQYAIDAFKVNSIDYLLKPIKEEELLLSIRKYEQLNRSGMDRELIDRIVKSVSLQKTTSFLVHHKDKLIPVSASDIAYFYIEEGMVRACTIKNQKHLMENTLEELEEMLDNKEFFRANRQYIINRKAIHDIEFYFNGRLSVNMSPASPDLVLVSKARAPVFKVWMTG